MMKIIKDGYDIQIRFHIQNESNIDIESIEKKIAKEIIDRKYDIYRESKNIIKFNDCARVSFRLSSESFYRLNKGIFLMNQIKNTTIIDFYYQTSMLAEIIIIPISTIAGFVYEPFFLFFTLILIFQFFIKTRTIKKTGENLFIGLFSEDLHDHGSS